MVIYFCNHLTNHSLNESGTYFSQISYSAVSEICKGLTIEMNNNKKLKKDIDEMGALLSNVKT
jgi:chromosomal replication initiation ATPase DnaA